MSLNVPLLNTKRSYADISSEIEEAALRVLRSGQYILGQEVIELENACAHYIGARHAIGVSSGTDALLLSLMALGIGPGDEVICPSFTFFATAGSIARAGAKPIFVDISPDCFTLDPCCIEQAISSHTKAIMPVHLFGQSANMKTILDIANRHSLYVIEDAAQAIGCEADGVQAGAWGIAGCFSFFPSKNLGGFGDAGLVVTSDDAFADELRCMRVHGGKTTYIHERIGGNFRIDPLQAALLAVKLKCLPGYEQSRISHAKIYFDRLASANGIVLPVLVRGKHIYNQFTIRVLNGKRNDLQAYLKDNGIASAIYYPLPLHQQKCFAYLNDVVPCLSHTELLAKECLSLPIAAELTDTEIQYVTEKILDFLS